MKVDGQVVENGLEMRFHDVGGYHVAARLPLKAGTAIVKEAAAALAVPVQSLLCRKCLLPVPRTIGQTPAPRFNCKRCLQVLYCSSHCLKSHLNIHIKSGECSLLSSPAVGHGLCGLLREACLALELLQRPPLQLLCSNEDQLLGQGGDVQSEQAQALRLAAEQAHAAWVHAQQEAEEEPSDSDDSSCKASKPIRLIKLSDVLTTLSQVVTNCVEVLPSSVGIEGDSDVVPHHAPLGLYSLLARFNHSCHPNAHFYWGQNNTLTVRLVRDVEPGEPISITYVDLLTPRHQRVPYLHSKYKFHCQCTRCNVPPHRAPSEHVPPPADFWLTAVAAPLPDRPAGSQDTLWLVRVAGDTGVDDMTAGGGGEMMLVAVPESGSTRVVNLDVVTEVHRAACQQHLVEVEGRIQQTLQEAEEQLLGKRNAAACLTLIPTALSRITAQGLHPFHYMSLQLYALLASAAVECASHTQSPAGCWQRPIRAALSPAQCSPTNGDICGHSNADLVDAAQTRVNALARSEKAPVLHGTHRHSTSATGLGERQQAVDESVEVLKGENIMLDEVTPGRASKRQKVEEFASGFRKKEDMIRESAGGMETEGLKQKDLATKVNGRAMRIVHHHGQGEALRESADIVDVGEAAPEDAGGETNDDALLTVRDEGCDIPHAWGCGLRYSMSSALAIQTFMEAGESGALPAAAKAWSITTHIICCALKGLLEMGIGIDKDSQENREHGASAKNTLMCIQSSPQDPHRQKQLQGLDNADLARGSDDGGSPQADWAQRQGLRKRNGVPLQEAKESGEKDAAVGNLEGTFQEVVNKYVVQLKCRLLSEAVLKLWRIVDQLSGLQGFAMTPDTILPAVASPAAADSLQAAKCQGWLREGFKDGLMLQLAEVCVVFLAHSMLLHELAYGDASMLAEGCAFLPFTAQIPMQQAAAVTAAAAAVVKGMR